MSRSNNDTIGNWIRTVRERHTLPTEELRRQLQAEVDSLASQLASSGAGPVSPAALSAATADCETLAVKVRNLEDQVRHAIATCMADCVGRLARNDAKVHVEALRAAEEFFGCSRDELVQTSRNRLVEFLGKQQSKLAAAREQLCEIVSEAHKMVADAAQDFQRHKALCAEQDSLNHEIEELRRQLQQNHGGIPSTVLDAWGDIGDVSTLIDECARLTNDAKLEGTWKLSTDVLAKFRIPTGKHGS